MALYQKIQNKKQAISIGLPTIRPEIMTHITGSVREKNRLYKHTWTIRYSEFTLLKTGCRTRLYTLEMHTSG